MLVRRGGRIVDNLLRLGSCSSAGPARDQAKRRWLGRRGAGFAEEALDLAKRRWIWRRDAGLGYEERFPSQEQLFQGGTSAALRHFQRLINYALEMAKNFIAKRLVALVAR